MRYFKYNDAKKYINAVLKEQYASLTRDEKKTYRKWRFLRRLSIIVGLIIFLSVCIAGFCAITLIPVPEEWWWTVVYGIGIFPLGILVLIISGLFMYYLTLPMQKMAEKYDLLLLKKKIPSKACAFLRDYYELSEPYVLTKCFECTDAKFNMHDVCLFITNDELRITTDLISGFLHGERDLGCYCFKKEEISVTKRQDGKNLIAELKTENVVFLLGYRAKSFIEKNFISKN